MIVGLGMDLVEIARIRRSLSRFGELFLSRLFHATELAALGPLADREGVLAARVAARFAAKEAAAKALGTGFALGVTLHDIRIFSEPDGKPRLELHGQALARAGSLGVSSALITLTHEKSIAGAVVVLEKLP